MRFVGAVKVAHDSYHGLGCHAANLAAPARLRVQD
jgi:hypothetical protein